MHLSNPLKTYLSSILAGLVLAVFAHGQPEARHGLNYKTPAMVWDEAMPLGNGLLGALVWGHGRPLRISLDRTDLWDLRPVPEFQGKDYSYRTMRQWVKEGRLADLHRLYDDPYGNPGPTKIPAGRIELTLGDDAVFENASLDLAGAAATVEFGDNSKAEVFVHASASSCWRRLLQARLPTMPGQAKSAPATLRALDTKHLSNRAATTGPAICSKVGADSSSP